MKNNDNRRRFSAGTVFMLAMLAIVLAGSAAVLIRLSSGASVNLNRLNMQILNLQTGRREDSGTETAPVHGKQEESPSGFPEAPAGASLTAASPPTGDGAGANGNAPGGREETTVKPAAAETAAEPVTGSYTLTAAGSVCLEGDVRKDAWNTDSKAYDLSDTMLLLKPELQGNFKAVFLENLFSGTEKTNDTVAPEELADLLADAGFTMAACGFSKAYDKGPEGVAATWMTLDERGVIPTGIRPEERQGKLETVTVNGVRTVFLQYTATVPSKTRKKMIKADTSGMVPEAEISLIAEEIDIARKQGAEAVIVLLKWGKTDSRPDSAQRELAAQIAQAGADLIIGSGSRIPQSAEYLDGRDGAKVLCAWSLGSLITGDRSKPSHIAGYLLHVTVRKNGKGGADILAPEYTPVYTWKYRQDGRYYYRCLASDQPAPDGMDAEQQKNMAKAEKAVSDMLAGSPLTLRTR